MKNTQEIKTHTMPDLPSVKERLHDITQALQSLTVEELKKCHRFFPDIVIKGLDKRRLIKVLAEAMTFETEKDFRDWFFNFPGLIQNLLYRLAFDSFVPAKKLEEEFDSPLVQQISEYSWTRKWALLRGLGLDISVFDQCGQPILYLSGVVRTILTLWLVPPPGLKLEECVVSGGEGPAWDNSTEIADSLPLLYDAIVDYFESVKPPDSSFKCVRGFKKKDVDMLRTSSAFKSFPVPEMPDVPGDAGGAEEQKTGQKKGRKAATGNDLKAQDLIPDSADLVARFILSMKNFTIDRPADGQDEVKALIQAFFNKTSQFEDYINPPDRHSLEYNVLFDHVTKGTDYYLKYESALPASRGTFRDILMFCAKDGRTFDADQIARLIFRTLRPFSFYYNDITRILKYRADELRVDGQTYTEKYSDILEVQGILEYYLVVTPVFKAYCYLFAALGILEITQAMPPLVRTLKEKKRPISCYDSLKTFRVTEFGKWCLGLTKKRPPRIISEYQAIADKELFLVTVQGNSLERTIYLDKIGRKLGSNRWRISPDSFIAGCSEKKQIEERVAKFKTLIDPNPAPHWLALFEKTVTRAGLFDYPLSGHLVYQLPTDRTLSEELLGDPEFRDLVHRAERGLIVIPEKNLKKFQAVLNAHGIVTFT
jgi:hypothetical protein